MTVPAYRMNRPWGWKSLIERKYGNDPYVPSYPIFEFDPENWFKKPMTTLTKPQIRLHCGYYPSGVQYWYAVVRVPVENHPAIEVLRWKSPTYNDLSQLLGRVKGYMRKGR